jgi:hypothetical protein
LSELSGDDKRPSPEDQNEDEDEIPRLGVLSTIPKRTFSRVVLLLAALVGVIYLRQRTESIAGCMASAFDVPPPAGAKRTSAAMKARVVLPPDRAKDRP